jgi:hypothetical protein
MPELDVRSPARPPPDSKIAAAVLLAALAGASLGARAVAVRWVIRRGADLKIGMAGRRAPAYVLGLLPPLEEAAICVPEAVAADVAAFTALGDVGLPSGQERLPRPHVRRVGLGRCRKRRAAADVVAHQHLRGEPPRPPFGEQVHA